MNSEVLAAADGTAYTHNDQGANSFGNHVNIDHGDGYFTLYAHLKEFKVYDGQHVKQGQVIGIEDTTGFSTGEHIHFGLHSGDSKTDALSSESVLVENLIAKDTTINSSFTSMKGDSFICAEGVGHLYKSNNIQIKALAKIDIEDRPEVYWLQNGKAYHVLDFVYVDMNNVAKIPGWNRNKVYKYPEIVFRTRLPKTYGLADDYILAADFVTLGPESNGLLLSPDGIKVYLIFYGKRYLIESPDLFNQLRLDWNNVIDVSQSILDMFMEATLNFCPISYTNMSLSGQTNLKFLGGIPLEDGTSSNSDPLADAFNCNGGFSEVGCPLGIPYPRGDGIIQNYDGGNGGNGALMVRNGANIAYWVHGDIWGKYESLGGPDSFLGYPLSDEYIGSTNYSRTDFVGGYITTPDGINYEAYPLPPVLISPGKPKESEAEITTTTPTFQWNTVSGADLYGLYVSKSPYGLENLVYRNELIPGNLTSFTLPKEHSLPSGIYRWNMSAHNSENWSDPQLDRLYFQVNVSTQNPTICLNQPSFSFIADENGVNPPDQTLNVWNCGGGTLSWSVSTNANWLSLNPTTDNSTGENDPVKISVNISGLRSTIYSAIITTSGIGATNAPQTASVTLIVNPGHILTITSPATGLPNPITPGGTANLSVAAADSLDHELGYSWVVSCANLSPSGILSGSVTRSPTWTAPQNSTGSAQICTINVTVIDGYGLSQESSYEQIVSPGGTPSLTIIDGIRLIEPFPYNTSEKATVEATIKNIGSATVILDRIQAVGEFRDRWGSIYEKFWPAEEFLPAKSFSPGDTYKYTQLLSDGLTGLPTTATVMIYVKFNKIAGQDPITNFESGATAQLSFEVGHILEVIAQASGNPNPVDSEGAVYLDVRAVDSLGHGLSYQWTADCSSAIGGNGQFISTSISTPNWIAPRNSTGSQQVCTIKVVINDGHDLSKESFLLLEVKSPTGDISGDGIFDLTDAILVLQVLSGVHAGPISLKADVNNDGKIGLEEVLYIFQKVAGFR